MRSTLFTLLLAVATVSYSAGTQRAAQLRTATFTMIGTLDGPNETAGSAVIVISDSDGPCPVAIHITAEGMDAMARQYDAWKFNRGAGLAAYDGGLYGHPAFFVSPPQAYVVRSCTGD